jgi:5-methylcytosine-specific restriction endonuclease McrA
MAFTEAVKLSIKKKAHFRCCICQAIGVEVHHILPQAEGGPDTEDNAAPLCPSCHEIYGANPEKRKFIREVRGFWYEVCEQRFVTDPNVIQELTTFMQETAMALAAITDELRKLQR